MVNEQLLRDTLEHIKVNPQSWHQDMWYAWVDPDGNTHNYKFDILVEEINSCGSAMCFAGHAALKAGFPKPPKPSEVENAFAVWKDENGTPVDAFAAEKLGLTPSQAMILFASENTLEDLETLVEALIENPNIHGDDLEDLVRPYEDERCECGCEDDDEEDYF